MDGSAFRKIAAEAGTFFTRAKQFTEEKLGQAERTELDAHFENLLHRADKTKQYTEALVDNTRNVLQPNPNARMEESVFDKLDRKKRDRPTETEALGQTMIDGANEFGPGTSYGAALLKVGAAEQKLGQAEREFNSTATNTFIQPLRAFLDGDMKTVQKERKVLENKRLDLDAAKTRLRRAKAMSSKEQAEAELRVAQAEFDRQCEITRLLLEGISSTHAHHQRCLHDFVESQANYYAQCHQYMIDLQRQLGSFSTGSGARTAAANSAGFHHNNQPGLNCITTSTNKILTTTSTATRPSAPSPPLHGGDLLSSPSSPTSPNQIPTNSKGRQARVLYDYDAAGREELSLIADETITIYQLSESDSDWVMGERNGVQRGKVPFTYLELQD